MAAAAHGNRPPAHPRSLMAGGQRCPRLPLSSPPHRARAHSGVGMGSPCLPLAACTEHETFKVLLSWPTTASPTPPPASWTRGIPEVSHLCTSCKAESPLQMKKTPWGRSPSPDFGTTWVLLGPSARSHAPPHLHRQVHSRCQAPRSPLGGSGAEHASPSTASGTGEAAQATRAGQLPRPASTHQILT